MAAFEDLTARWQEEPFPRGSAIDGLDEIHADLALVDSWVAESVLPYLESAQWLPAVPDVLAELRRIVDAARARPLAEQDTARAYVTYAHLLEEVYSAFLALRPV